MTQIGFEAFQMLNLFEHMFGAPVLLLWLGLANGSPIRTLRQGMGDCCVLTPWPPAGHAVLGDSILLRK